MISLQHEARNASEPLPETMAPAKVVQQRLREPQRVLFAGDTHMVTSQVEYLIRMARKESCEAIVQLGDFGFWAHHTDGLIFLRKVAKMLAREKIDLYWLDGNHDNHGLLWSYPHPRTDGWPTIAPHLYYVPRGTRWAWRGVRFLAMGGAYSVDKVERLAWEKKMDRPRSRWWHQETITDEQVEAAGTETVDVLLAHDAPWLTVMPELYKRDLETELNRRQLLKIVTATKPKLILHGHHHMRYTGHLEVMSERYLATVQGLDRDGSGDRSWLVLDLDDFNEKGENA